MGSAAALFATVALAHGLAVASPGPDFAMVTRQTLAFGRTAGFWTSLGIGAGISFHVAYGMFGLGWMIERWPAMLDAMRYVGAAFLLYMGVVALRAQPLAPSAATATAEAGNWAHHFGIGVLTNVLNPKAMLFFVALCSAVITAATPVFLRVLMGLWLVFATAAWFCFVSFTLGHSRIRDRLVGRAHWIDRAMGAILMVLATLMVAA